MTTNVNIGIDEVVSVFVTKYEDGLFAKKDALSANIRVKKSAVSDLEKHMIASVNKDEYSATVEILNVEFFADEVTLCWEGYNYGNIPKNSLKVNIQQREIGQTKSSSFKTIAVPMAQFDVDEMAALKADLERLNAELLEVMGLIKSVSRKERQIRGRISEMKLAECGQSDLINSTELLKLVDVK
jgi:hypothetical protein